MNKTHGWLTPCLAVLLFLVACVGEDQLERDVATDPLPEARAEAGRAESQAGVVIAPDDVPIHYSTYGAGAPALVFVFVVAATWFRSRGTALLHTWRSWQAIGLALAVVYTHVVCVASRCPAALARWLDDEDLAEMRVALQEK